MSSILLEVVAQQHVNTSPTYQVVLYIMDLRSELEEEHFQIIGNYYIAASEINTVEDALFTSETFLQDITDIDGIFQTTGKACFKGAAEITLLIDAATNTDPTVGSRLEDLQFKYLDKNFDSPPQPMGRLAADSRGLR